MSQPISTLLKHNLEGWLSARGLWLVFGAALIPFILTGAWVMTHQGDAAPGPIDVGDSARIERGWIVAEAGRNVTITAPVENRGTATLRGFNASLSVGTVQQNRFTPLSGATSTERIRELAPGERRELSFVWPARTVASFRGQLGVLVMADPDDEVGESQEENNQRFMPFLVTQARPTDPPAAPGNLTGNASANRTLDARVASLTLQPEAPRPESNMTVTARFANDGPEDLINATVHVEVGRVVAGQFSPFQSTTETVNVSAGEDVPVTLDWTTRRGGYWARAWVNVTDDGVRDVDASDNHRAESFTVDPEITESFEQPQPPEKLTIKQFYVDLLNLLHLRVLIPFIALFYAGGVVSDEKRRGNLTYLLTRPIDRWLFPATKFASGYVVAAAVVALGVVASFFLLFGSPSVDMGFLTTSLILSLVALLVYGCFFILLGTLTDRPYLIGIAFVIGWEGIAGNFVPWVQNLTIIHHLSQVIERVSLEEGFLFASQPLGIVLAAAAAFLVAASVVMRRREFDL